MSRIDQCHHITSGNPKSKYITNKFEVYVPKMTDSFKDAGVSNCTEMNTDSAPDTFSHLSLTTGDECDTFSNYYFDQEMASDSFTASFIRDKVLQRECSKYCKQNVAKGDECCCGRRLSWHRDKKLFEDIAGDGQWKSDTCTKTTKCTSFGRIRFDRRGFNEGKSPYVRLDYQTDLRTVWTILTQLWALKKPKLLISVTGGAKRFKLLPWLKSTLKKGLINVAVSTGAWIVTGGTATGVMELVGEAVKEYESSLARHQQSKCVAIGIAPWGYVAHHDDLNKEIQFEEGDALLRRSQGKIHGRIPDFPCMGKSDNTTTGEMTGLYPADYFTEEIQTDNKESAALDPNHTHFLLIDDGTVGKYGGEIEFRSKLESYISKVDKEEQVPTVLIVVEGGLNTLKTVHKSLKQKIPVVIIGGSGRVADYIAYASTKFKSSDDEPFFGKAFEREMQEKAGEVFERKLSTKQLKKAVSDLKNCLKERNLLNICKVDRANSAKDIDRAILHALLRANQSSSLSQLNLAMDWNRCDIARQEIFSLANRRHWQDPKLLKYMTKALKNNQPEFVKLFVDFGVDVNKYLKVQRLKKLYVKCLKQEGEASKLLRFLIVKQKQTTLSKICRCYPPAWGDFPDLLKVVGKVIASLMKDEKFNFYAAPENVNNNNGSQNEYSARDLLVWAVLLNRVELARYFWKQGQDYIGGALFVAALSESLCSAAKSHDSVTLGNNFYNQALLFKKLAVSVLSECATIDDNRAHQLLVRNLPNWVRPMDEVGTSVLILAESYDLMDFTQEPTVKTKLTSIWKGRMAPLTCRWLIFLAAIFPFLVHFIDFTKEPKFESHCAQRQNKVSSSDKIAEKRLVNFKKVGYCCKEKYICLFSAVWLFYHAPVTKFIFNWLLYMGLLCIFSYFLLVEFSPPDYPSKWEIITDVWVLTMVMEELRQIVASDTASLRFKLVRWWHDYWNRFDLVMYVMFLVSFVTRFTQSAEFAARPLYSVTLVFFFLRIMQFFYADPLLGPKVVMIIKMITDLKTFFALLLVFMLSFGVVYHANLYPYSSPTWRMLEKIFYFPYFQIYGELFLEEMKGNVVDCTRNETLWREDPDSRCPSGNPFVLFLNALYLMFTTILLVNLLIAMLNHTFVEMHKDSSKIWNYYKLSLAYEFASYPVLVPPFIVLNHAYRTLCWLYLKCRHKCDKEKGRNAFKMNFNSEDDNLIAFERRCMENANINSKLKLQSVTDSTTERYKLRELQQEEKIENLREKMDELTLMSTSQQEQLLNISKMLEKLLGQQDNTTDSRNKSRVSNSPEI